MKTNERALILLVDDTRDNIRLLASILEADYDLAIACNGAQALDIVKDTLPDLILLDVMLPDIDGYQVCRRLKQNPATASIPVLFITAKHEIEDIVRGFQTGAVDYLSKPFIREELLVRVQSQIRLQRLRMELEEKNAALLKLSETDTLTGLDNRRVLHQKLSQSILLSERYRFPLSIIMIDIDHFKMINDTHGHLVGDEALVALSATLQKSIRSSDFVGRFGGEEFLVGLSHTDLENAHMVAEKIRTTVQAMEFSNAGLHATISCGIAMLIANEGMNGLISRADKALYRAKTEGRNCTRIY